MVILRIADCGFPMANCDSAGAETLGRSQFGLLRPVSRPRQKGFTIIELLVVITIIGILAGIALFSVRNAQRKAAENVLRADLTLMRKSIDDFYADKQRFPNSLQELVDEKYLRKVPVDPVTKSADTWVTVTVSEDPTTLTQEEGSEDPNAGQGITDVKSGAEGETLDKVPYSEL